MIGKKIRERRKELNISLRELGEATNLSASFLSQVENDQTSPSISSLQSIAAALRIPMFTFLDDDQPSETVVREANRRNLKFPESGVNYELLTNDMNRQMVGFILRMDPGGRHQARPLLRPPEEIIYVIQGEMEIQLGERVHHLFRGDSIHYEGIQLKEFGSVGTDELVIICVMTPPAL